MRKIAIFILSLPLLALAILWMPIGVLLIIAAAPLWTLLALIDWLRGRGFDIGGLMFAPLMGFDMYLETTGFAPSIQRKFENL